MSLLFANISTDRVQLIADGKETILPHGDMEKTVADFLYSGAMEGVQKVFLINGPGSFTHLRITTLALNMYNFLHQHSLGFYTIDKLTLYQKLYHKNILPRTGYIYIGQKKNWRKVDLKTLQHEVALLPTEEGDYFTDHLFVEEGLHNMVRISCDWGNFHITSKGDEHVFPLAELELEPLKAVEPNYMMDANVTIKEY